jgi:hypothetical protein
MSEMLVAEANEAARFEGAAGTTTPEIVVAEATAV